MPEHNFPKRLDSFSDEDVNCMGRLIEDQARLHLSVDKDRSVANFEFDPGDLTLTVKFAFSVEPVKFAEFIQRMQRLFDGANTGQGSAGHVFPLGGIDPYAGRGFQIHGNPRALLEYARSQSQPRIPYIDAIRIRYSLEGQGAAPESTAGMHSQREKESDTARIVSYIQTKAQKKFGTAMGYRAHVIFNGENFFTVRINPKPERMKMGEFISDLREAFGAKDVVGQPDFSPSSVRIHYFPRGTPEAGDSFQIQGKPRELLFNILTHTPIDESDRYDIQGFPWHMMDGPGRKR